MDLYTSYAIDQRVVTDGMEYGSRYGLHTSSGDVGLELQVCRLLTRWLSAVATRISLIG